jgi:hypothetical protein
VPIENAVERCHAREAGAGRHAFEAGGEQHRPEQIQELRAQEERPSEVRGASRFAPKPTPKWPMNIRVGSAAARSYMIR